MDTYIVAITLIGFAAFGMAWMPAITKRTGISYAILYVLAGVLVYSVIPGSLPSANPDEHSESALRLTELVVIISIMGTGIKIDRPFSFKNWASPLKLVVIAMILCITAASFMGYFLLNLDVASAILLGAVLAPTDPVLASDVQVGPPHETKKSETKFALTAEAGLNDGMAFPFTWLAVLLATSTMTATDYLSWAGYNIFYKIGVGLVIGFIAGKAVGYLVFRVAEKYPLLRTHDGFVAVSLTLLVYGLTELLHGYGFIAVFICAINLRHFEKGHEFHKELHSFTDQIERLLVVILLIFFGGSLVSGILDVLTWKMALFTVLFLFIARPVAGYISLFSGKFHLKEKLAISFFGIRGMGSVYYLAFAFKETSFEYKKELWAIVAFTILVSVVIHGLSATFTMNHLVKELPDEKIPE